MNDAEVTAYLNRVSPVATPHTIEPTDDYPVLAIDTFQKWGATFQFSVNHKGGWSENCTYAQRRDDGSWAELGSGGAHGDGWEPSWRPPEGGWSDEPLQLMGTFGLDVEDDAESVLSLSVSCGFVTPAVATLRVEHDGRQRAIRTLSPVGAFVVVTVGVTEVTITPMNSDAVAVGRARVPSQP